MEGTVGNQAATDTAKGHAILLDDVNEIHASLEVVDVLLMVAVGVCHDAAPSRAGDSGAFPISLAMTSATGSLQQGQDILEATNFLEELRRALNEAGQVKLADLAAILNRTAEV
jgi:hypothetical protein